jgi:glucosamine-6-phosphate deaminase
MGQAAALAVRASLLSLLEKQKNVRMVFAAAPSQLEFLASFVLLPGISWERIIGFHMDEYLGIGYDSPQSFGRFLREHLFDRVNMRRVEYIDPTPADPEAECRRYADFLNEEPIDIVCMGIGENGHIAFNDPPVADFSDPLSVKVVELDVRCREQQVHDGSFLKFEDVPLHAITLTVPRLLSARKIFVVVPGPRKAEAVFAALRGPLTTACPASALRTHNDVEIFLDTDAASLLRLQ